MKKKTVVAFLVAFCAVFVFSACDEYDRIEIRDPYDYGTGIVPTENYQEIDCEIADEFFTTSSDSLSSRYLVATSLSQFKEWCEDRKLPYFDETSDCYYSQKSVGMRQTYTDGYFEENALVLINYVMSSYDTFFIDGLRLSDGFLTVVGVRPKGEYPTDDVITSYFGIFEVAKEDVSYVKAINIAFMKK